MILYGNWTTPQWSRWFKISRVIRRSCIAWRVSVDVRCRSIPIIWFFLFISNESKFRQDNHFIRRTRATLKLNIPLKNRTLPVCSCPQTLRLVISKRINTCMYTDLQICWSCSQHIKLMTKAGTKTAPRINHPSPKTPTQKHHTTFFLPWAASSPWWAITFNASVHHLIYPGCQISLIILSRFTMSWHFTSSL